MAFNFPPQIVLLYPFYVCRFYSSFTADSYYFIAPFLRRKENIAFWEAQKFNFLSRLRYEMFLKEMLGIFQGMC